MKIHAKTYSASIKRTIEISRVDDNIIAEFYDNLDELPPECFKTIEIGKAEFVYMDTEENDRTGYQLIHLEVDKCFRRGGIAIEMLLVAEEYFEDFVINTHLSLQGAATINYMKKNKLFTLPHEYIEDDKY